MNRVFLVQTDFLRGLVKTQKLVMKVIFNWLIKHCNLQVKGNFLMGHPSMTVTQGNCKTIPSRCSRCRVEGMNLLTLQLTKRQLILIKRVSYLHP